MDGSLPFDRSAEGWKRDALPKSSVYACKAKYPYAFEGNPRFRRCGHCSGCLALAKRDRASRAAAEAAVAAEVIGLTLTYRPGEPGLDRFLVEDVQRMMKRLRQQARRDAIKRLGLRERGRKTDEEKRAIAAEIPALFYLRVGERGTKRGRRHWHMAIFADKPTGWKSSPSKPPKPGRVRGELQAEDRPELWPHGLVTVDVMPGGSGQSEPERFAPADLIRMAREGYRPPSRDAAGPVKLARYLHKYLEKGRGVSLRDRKVSQKQADVVFGASNRRPMGAGWICEEARRCARAGLPFDGQYYVPGVRFSRASVSSRRDRHGNKLAVGGALHEALRADWRSSQTGRETKSGIFGRCRDHAIAAYREEWARVRGDAPMPRSEFCHWYDKERVAGDYTVPRGYEFRWAQRSAVPVILPPYRDPGRAGHLMLDVRGRGNVGLVRVWDTGVAKFIPNDGAAVFLPAGDLSQQLPMLDQLGRQRVEAWLSDKRGPGWLSPVEWKAAAQLLAQERDAAIARFARPGELVIRDDLPVIEEDTALRRQLRLNRTGHHAAVVAGLRRRPAPARASAPLSEKPAAVGSSIRAPGERARVALGNKASSGLPGSPPVLGDRPRHMEWVWPKAAKGG